MKKTINLIAIYATLGLIALLFANVIELKAQTPTPTPAKAQTPAQTPAPAQAQTPAPAAAQAQCTAEKKQAWYVEFRAIFKTDQTKAYDLAQKYLACPAEAGEESIRNYLQNTFVAVIDKARRTPKVTELVYDKKDYAKAFELGKQVLADEPDNVKVLMDLAYAGYLANSTKVDTFSVDALSYAKKAIQLIEAGKAPENWVPYSGKDEAHAYLNNTIGVLTMAKNPSEALPYLIKAAQLEGKLKKQAITYGYIGDAYQSGPYDRLSAEYKRLYEGKDETPESKLALENVNQVIDRMIDAYARAVALSGTDAASQASKKAWMDTLTTWYKYRTKSDAGLTDMIATVMSKPLPPEPTPLTTLPATAPTTTTTPASGTPTTGSANGTAAPAATGKPATTPASTPATTAPKPTTPTATTEVKPKPKNNHPRPKTRRHN